MKTAKKLSDKVLVLEVNVLQVDLSSQLLLPMIWLISWKQSGTEMARTEVTREINKYIRANSLQDAQNGRKINPDDKLAKLLNLKKSDELTYFNLQRYMSPHFPKSAAATATATK